MVYNSFTDRLSGRKVFTLNTFRFIFNSETLARVYMPRIRTIKPESSFNDQLFDMEIDTGWPIRFIWAVLPCHCDRAGRFKYHPKRLKAQILPWDDLDFSEVLDRLWKGGFIERYTHEDSDYGCIPTFLDHQVINNRESDSKLPEPNENNMLTRESGVKAEGKEGRKGKGKEGRKGKEPALL